MRLPDDDAVAPTMQLGLLGHIGITAYFGLLEIGRPRAGETLVVSSAAGAVGSLVGQLGKLYGCRVVGIAGTAEKCRWLREDLGFDAAVNYKTEPVFKRLKEHCPRGIDIYFDNVGGAMLEDALNLLNEHARVVACGMLSLYNDVGGMLTFPAGPNNLLNLTLKRARMEGFVCLDFWPRAAEALRALARWHAEGKLKYRVDVVEGLRNAPRALNRLFDSSNRGKLVIKMS
jgi:NADPH-dependent curcumin reductase CurA